MVEVSRRSVLQGAVAAGVIPSVLGGSPAQAADAVTSASGIRQSLAPTGHGAVPLRWLEDAPRTLAGTTFGVPWPKGALPGDQTFALTAGDGTAIPVQTWPTAWWPDGSLKWSAHAVSGSAPISADYRIEPGAAEAPPVAVSVSASNGAVVVDTGVVVVTFPRKGSAVVEKIERAGVVIARAGTLVASTQSAPSSDAPEEVKTKRYQSTVKSVIVEQNGPVRAVVKVEGKHRQGKREWLPFTLRFSLFAGSDAIRLVHTFIFDGDETTDFLNGLGVEFAVPMRGELHDRHIRLAGSGGGVLGEAVRPVTGLRRDPGAAVRAAQIAGQALPDPATWDQRVTSRLHWIPAWGDFRLTQLNAHGFEIVKRTGAGASWIRSDGGDRAAGLGYVGSPTGGLAFGMKDFWQLHPTELEISGATEDEATARVWMWSPRAGSMDLRFYHDGLGQDTYAEQLDALEITYEDYEPGFATPYGVARTTELTFWALAATPTNESFSALAGAGALPPLLRAEPAHLHSAGVFGSWAPVDRSTAARTRIEDRLDAIMAYHRGQVDQRSWYGFWDYGDIMHEYDGDRHVWRYDIGGYAWDNSELSTDLWIWYHYLRTGDAATYRFAEAMTRHTGEVDQYHLGDWAGLGTRHGVQHWGDSAKQVRISNANYRRFHYFLTGDERAGDLLHSLIVSDKTFLLLDPGRKVDPGGAWPPPANAVPVGTTTDWGALAGAWLTEWERGGDPIAKTKLVNGLTSIAALPNGWAQGGAITYDLADGTFTGPTEKQVSVGSLSSVFGLIEVMTEAVELVDDDAVREKWLEFCRLYNSTSAEQKAATGASWGSLNLKQSYSRASAYAAAQLDDPVLATRAWTEFKTGHAGYADSKDFGTTRIEGPAVLNPVDQGGFSANASAQYGLAAIQCLALIGDSLT
ncbi:exo-rhamnogalacturonan lyase family protein [Microbacterium gilvum]|uniref:Tat pathway signal sequence domain protein n=1 Tax=Microbacterium gilvum TaxID=1336204 RepID=A0ABP8ZYM5_9MICO